MTVSRSLDDEARFHVRSARAYIEDAAEVPEVLEFCREHAIRFLIARCPADEIGSVEALEDAGLRLMDTLVVYARPTDDWTAVSTGDISIAPLASAEVDIIEAIAQEAFRNYYGHYHADRRLDSVLCDDIYVDWAKKCSTSREHADVVLLARIASSPAGFMALRVTDGEGDLMLSGVLPAFASRGVFRSLVAAGLTWFKERNVKTAILPTHINNIPVHRACCRLGFAPARATYTLHGWFQR